jgi:DNA-binding MarR family transcriptional regulator
VNAENSVHLVPRQPRTAQDMSHKASHWAFEKEGLSPAAKLVLILLADWADESGMAWPKQRTIAEKAGLSLRTVRDIVTLLEKLGHIRRIQTRRRDGRRGVDNYKLSLN